MMLLCYPDQTVAAWKYDSESSKDVKEIIIAQVKSNISRLKLDLPI